MPKIQHVKGVMKSKNNLQEDAMKTNFKKAMMLALLMGTLAGCSESPKAFPFGPIPHDKEASQDADQE